MPKADLSQGARCLLTCRLLHHADKSKSRHRDKCRDGCCSPTHVRKIKSDAAQIWLTKGEGEKLPAPTCAAGVTRLRPPADNGRRCIRRRSPRRSGAVCLQRAGKLRDKFLRPAGRSKLANCSPLLRS